MSIRKYSVKMKEALGIAVIAVANIKETAVSIVSKLFSDQTPKEGVRGAAKSPALA